MYPSCPPALLPLGVLLCAWHVALLPFSVLWSLGHPDSCLVHPSREPFTLPSDMLEPWYMLSLQTCLPNILPFTCIPLFMCYCLPDMCSPSPLPADILTVVLGLFQIPILPWGYPFYPSWDWPLLKCWYKHTVSGSSSMLTFTSYTCLNSFH